MRTVLFAALAGALFTFAPASAATAAAAALEEAPSEKVVCKRNKDRTYTGSNLRGSDRICKTQSEWDRLKRDAEDTFRRMDATSMPRIPAPDRLGGGPTLPAPRGN